MKKRKPNKNREDYPIPLCGAHLDWHEAKKVYLALLIGLVCTVAIGLGFGIINRAAVFVIALVFVSLAYFRVARGGKKR